MSPRVIGWTDRRLYGWELTVEHIDTHDIRKVLRTTEVRITSPAGDHLDPGDEFLDGLTVANMETRIIEWLEARGHIGEAGMCGHNGGTGIGAGHVCRCVRAAGHPLDSDRPHGCSCMALWSDDR